MVILSAKSTMWITSDNADASVAEEELYYSESNRLSYIISSEIPFSEDDIVFDWQYSPINSITSNSATVWTITSTPLIVGDYVYIGCGELLFKLEAYSGACVKKAERAFNGPSFFHYLGYGDGVIIDFNDGELYDLDLNKKGSMGPLISSWYEGGLFYGIFKNGNTLELKSFSIEKSETYTAEYGSWTTDVTRWFRINGNTTVPVFTETHLYYVSATTADGNAMSPGKTFLNSVNLQTGEKKTLDLELDYRYMDDGWLTLHNGTIYLPTYTNGLFDQNDEETGSALTAVSIDNSGNMVKEFSLFFEETGVASNLIVYNDRGYINVCKKDITQGATFYVFDMTDLNENSEPIYTVSSEYTHGGIVLNDYYAEADGDVYIYFVPYENGALPGRPYLCMIHDNPDTTASRVQKFTLASAGNTGGLNYSSQTVRVTQDGHMLWYRDFGQVVCFTSVQNKSYDVLLLAGDNAKFVTLTEEELRGLGNDCITVSDKVIVNYVLSEQTVSDFNMYFYKDGSGWTQTTDSDLNNVSGSTYSQINSQSGCTINYLILSNGDTPEESTVYHAPNGKRVTIGNYVQDRSLIGIELTEGEPTIPEVQKPYALSLNISNSATDATIDITLTETDDSEPLENPRILVISAYEGGIAHNVCPTVGPFVDGMTVERVVVSNNDLVSVSIEVTDGIPVGTYAEYGSATYIADDPIPIDADYIITNDDTVYEFISGECYTLDILSESRISALTGISVTNGDGVVIDEIRPEIGSANIIWNVQSDGFFHAYCTVTITGPSIEMCIVAIEGLPYQFNAKIIGSDPEPPVPEEPDYVVNEGTSSTTVYEFVSGQTYFVEYITQRQRQASEFENLSIKVLDMATYEFTTTEHTIALTDLVIDAEREADGFHSRFLLTVTGPSLGPFDMMTDMMAAYLVNAESSFNIGIAVIGSDPEPPVPEDI